MTPGASSGTSSGWSQTARRRGPASSQAMVVPRLLVEQLARPSRLTGRLINLVKRASMTERSRRGAGTATGTAGNEHAVALDSRPDPLSLCNMHLALEASGLGMRGKHYRRVRSLLPTDGSATHDRKGDISAPLDQGPIRACGLPRTSRQLSETQHAGRPRALVARPHVGRRAPGAGSDCRLLANTPTARPRFPTCVRQDPHGEH
jgi:hypothetical protein